MRSNCILIKEGFGKTMYIGQEAILKVHYLANPNWAEQELKDLLFMHLQLLTDEVAAYLNKDWSGEIVAFDKGENHIILLGDEITNGIMKQFPHQFRN
jgi:hypothetical protein